MNNNLVQLDTYITTLESDNAKLINKNLEIASLADQLEAENVKLLGDVDILNKIIASKVDILPLNILLTAVNYMVRNIPYKFGAELDNGGFDCSSFMQQVFKDNGITLPRTSVKQGNVGNAVNSSVLGDLLVFDTNGDGIINHVGLAITDVLMIHTAKTGENINITNYKERYAGKLKGIRRVL